MSTSRNYSDARVLRLGAITLVVMLLVMAAAFNLSQFPGFRGSTYQAEFSDASGLHTGNMVQVGGIRVGRVKNVALVDSNTVLVTFEVDHGVEFGTESRASVEVLNLLGEKYLDLEPAGDGQLDEDEVIPRDRTESAYDIVGVFGDLTQTTERIDTDQLAKALNVVADTTNQAAPEIQSSFQGIARLSQSVASRDEQIQSLLKSSQSVSKVLSVRSQDLVDLMKHSDLVLREVKRRKQAIHLLLVNARDLADQLKGVAEDNQAQMGPALKQVDDLLALLNSKDEELKDTLHALGPYVSILGNIIGTGPWFDAYASNLAAIPTGEFLPGLQPGLDGGR
jgi:phospholipid/cholesterol/gamma-HCH transport system substrate-binding protein